MEELAVRRLRRVDLPLLLNWRNMPHVRQLTIANQGISESLHRKWFETIGARREEHFIYSRHDRDVGSFNLRFGEDGTSFEAGILCGEEDFLGHSINIYAAIKLYEYGFIFKEANTAFARVLRTNSRARRLNEFLGYKEQGAIAPGILYLRLEKAEFLQSRAKILKTTIRSI